jgi:hypothetical protein
MTTALAVALSLIFLPLGLAKLASAPFMRQAAAHLGLPVRLYRVVGALEVAGVAGLRAAAPCEGAAAPPRLRVGCHRTSASPSPLRSALDALGLVIGVVVQAASAHDNTAGTALLGQVVERCGMRLQKALVDQGF